MTDKFETIKRSILADMTLTDAERSLLFYISTKKPDWEFHDWQIQKETGRSGRWVRLGMRSLRRRGFLVASIPTRKPDGTITQQGSRAVRETFIHTTVGSETDLSVQPATNHVSAGRTVRSVINPVDNQPGSKATPLNEDGLRSEDSLPNEDVKKPHDGFSNQDHWRQCRQCFVAQKKLTQESGQRWVLPGYDTGEQIDIPATYDDPWA